jgi:hypothetical protein
MKKICLLALTALALTSCGGGGDDNASTTPTTPAADTTAATQGLWTGSIRSSVTNKSQTATLLVLATGQMRMFLNNCVLFTANSSTASGYFSSSSGEAYAPDGSISACPAAPFPDGTSLGTLTMNGQVTAGSSLIGTYANSTDTGSYNMTYSTAYARVGTLARLVGNYSNGTLALTIDANGVITGTIGTTTTITGTVTTIDTTKNAYQISLTETITSTGSTTTSTSTTSSTTGTTTTDTSTTTGTSSATQTVVSMSGYATLTDYSSGTDNYLLLALANTTAGMAIPLIRQ